MTRDGNTWTFSDYLDCGDFVAGTFTCNPSVDVSDCGNKWSASISIPCVQNLTITGQSTPCGCDEAPIFAFSGDTSECSCCNCPNDDLSVVCPACIPCSKYDDEFNATSCEQCIENFGHNCWTNTTFIYSCYNDCVLANCVP